MRREANESPHDCSPHRLRALTRHSTWYHSRPYYEMPLHALPDEALLGCVDGSMRLGTLLASTSKALRGRLQYAAKHGLRLLVGSSHIHGDAIAKVLAADGKGGLHVGEIIFARSPLRVDELKHLLERCKRLHSVRLSRHLPNGITRGMSYDEVFVRLFRQYPNFDLSRVTITTQPAIYVRSSQLQSRA